MNVDIKHLEVFWVKTLFLFWLVMLSKIHTHTHIWSLGLTYTQLYLKKIANKDILHSKGSFTQYSLIT